MSGAARAVIISGGSEIVSLAVAEALHAAGVAYAVASLVPHGLLRNAPGCVDYAFIGSAMTGHAELRTRLLDFVARLNSDGERLALFPTEDGGLRLLNEYRDEVLRYGEFARARRLRLGGLDKAELFEHLATTPSSAFLAPTIVLKSTAEADSAFERFGNDVIFKPSLKPWDMNLGPMPGKVITRTDANDGRDAVRRRLEQAWYLSERWLAQPRLTEYADGERGVWGLRGSDSFAGVQFVERWKYPVRGGSGCWVETVNARDLVPAAASILEALDFVGLAELPFLRNRDDAPCLLELNPRPWLQVGLAERSGFRIVSGACVALRGGKFTAPPPPDARASWVNIERAVLSVASGDAGPRLTGLRRLRAALASRPTLAVYGSSFPRVRRRWTWRMLNAALRRIVGTKA